MEAQELVIRLREWQAERKRSAKEDRWHEVEPLSAEDVLEAAERIAEE